MGLAEFTVILILSDMCTLEDEVNAILRNAGNFLPRTQLRNPEEQSSSAMLKISELAGCGLVPPFVTACAAVSPARE